MYLPKYTGKNILSPGSSVWKANDEQNYVRYFLIEFTLYQKEAHMPTLRQKRGRERFHEKTMRTLFTFLILIMVPSAFVPKVSFIATSPSMPNVPHFPKENHISHK